MLYQCVYSSQQLTELWVGEMFCQLKCMGVTMQAPVGMQVGCKVHGVLCNLIQQWGIE
jgi:hypothetical protein